MARRGSVLVISKDMLFRDVGGYFQGFKNLDPSILNVLESNSIWMDEDEAEKNPDFKELIAYCLLFTRDKKLFTYRRSKKDEAYPEKRLQGKWSIGVGGHIEPTDHSGTGLILTSLLREIPEEIRMNGRIKSIELLGGINDDLDSVGKDHFGLLMKVFTTSHSISPDGQEITTGYSMNPEEIRNLFQQEKNNVENWTQICFPHISC